MSQTPPNIYVAGHRGMVGSAIVRRLLREGVPESHLLMRSYAALDLTDQTAVRSFFAAEMHDQVYLAAAKEGGSHANNTKPADFIYDNLMIEANINAAAFRSGVQRLLQLHLSTIPAFYAV